MIIEIKRKMQDWVWYRGENKIAKKGKLRRVKIIWEEDDKIRIWYLLQLYGSWTLEWFDEDSIIKT